MATFLIRDLPPETHRALKLRARKNGRSLSAEICLALEESAQSPQPIRFGTQLQEFGRKYAKELSQIHFASLRDKSPIEYADFSGPEFDRLEFE